ncbi:hypothetical protein [Sodalinema gerasimenkoae]|nr:hypothetical protein [Sodalinema gerasimenkoae]
MLYLEEILWDEVRSMLDVDCVVEIMTRADLLWFGGTVGDLPLSELQFA